MNKEISDKLNKVMDDLLMYRPDNGKLKKIREKEVLDSSDMTILFQICAKTLYRWRKNSIIKFRKVSGKYYFLWVDVLPLLDVRSLI